MGESYAGITVPEGEPGALRAAASSLDGVAGRLDGTCGQLDALTGTVAAWQGPASSAYVADCRAQAAAARSAADALEPAAIALRRLADDLEEAKRDAREAIQDARDARERIEQARADIEEARQAQAAAALQTDVAVHRLAVESAAGVPPAAAEADLAAAQQAANEGADREAAARRRLEQAEDDFERAQRRGERAEARARDAGQAAAGAFGSGPAMPPIGAPGTTPVAFTNGGAAPVMASSTSDGGNPWYDIFVKPFNPWHDRTRYEMWRYVQEHAWGIPTAFIGSGMTYLSHHWMRMVPGAQLYAKVLGPDGVVRTLPHGYMHAHAVPDELARGQWASRARWLNRAGGALSFAGGFADQIVRDSGNPNLATDERIGRATVNGATIAAGALQGARWGAMAGSFIPIPGGTIIGGAVGAIVGGAIASGAVDYFNDGLVEIGGEIGDKVGDGIEKVGEGLDAAGEALEDAGGAVKDFFGF